jgi:hypothetical protein
MLLSKLRVCVCRNSNFVHTLLNLKKRGTKNFWDHPVTLRPLPANNYFTDAIGNPHKKEHCLIGYRHNYIDHFVRATMCGTMFLISKTTKRVLLHRY